MALIMLVSSLLDVGAASSEMLLNLGTELLGIVVTITVVEYLLNRLSRRERAESIAWRYLQELDHAVWIWLGGSRDFDLDELCMLLSKVKSGDPLAAFTQNLFLRLAIRAQTALKTKSRLVSHEGALRLGLKELASLASLRDDRGRVEDSTLIAERLLGATRLLSDLVNLDGTPGNFFTLPDKTDSSYTMQKWRFFGREPSREGNYRPPGTDDGDGAKLTESLVRTADNTTPWRTKDDDT